MDGLIDNSSYAKLDWELIGLGKEVDYLKFCEYSTDIYFKNIKIYVFTKTMWTLLDKSSPRYFSQAREDIRNALDAAHLKVQSEYPKPIYVSYHCAINATARRQRKKRSSTRSYANSALTRLCT